MNYSLGRRFLDENMSFAYETIEFIRNGEGLGEQEMLLLEIGNDGGCQ